MLRCLDYQVLVCTEGLPPVHVVSNQFTVEGSDSRVGGAGGAPRHLPFIRRTSYPFEQLLNVYLIKEEPIIKVHVTDLAPNE